MAPKRPRTNKPIEKISVQELMRRFPDRYTPHSAPARMIGNGSDGDESVKDIEQEPTIALKQDADDSEDDAAKPKSVYIECSTNGTNPNGTDTTKIHLDKTTKIPTTACNDLKMSSTAPKSDPLASSDPELLAPSPRPTVEELSRPPTAYAAPQEPKPRLAGWEHIVNVAGNHLDIVRWKPQYRGNLPVTDDQHLFCIRAIASALQHSGKARDHAQRPTVFASFASGLVYSRRDIETTSASLLHQAIRLYNHGATSLFYATPSNRPRREDADLTFEQRIRAFQILVLEFKKAADDVMCGRCHEEFLTAPNASWHALNDQLLHWENAMKQRQMAALYAQGVALQNQARMMGMSGFADPSTVTAQARQAAYDSSKNAQQMPPDFRHRMPPNQHPPAGYAQPDIYRAIRPSPFAVPTDAQRDHDDTLRDPAGIGANRFPGPQLNQPGTKRHRHG
ncbi:Nn.00g012380.m01.CDS01 [Neocucurbitaria sp. VM-36]